MAQKPISIEQSASQMVGNVNDNFDELYRGAGSGSGGSSTAQEVLYYQLKASGATNQYYKLGLKEGDKVAVFKHPSNSSATYPRTYSGMAYVLVCGTDAWTPNKNTPTTELPTLVKTRPNVKYSSVDTTPTEDESEDTGWGIEKTLDKDYDYVCAVAGRYIIKVERTVDVSIKQPANSPLLYGKRWLLIGDSISTEGGGYASKSYGTYVAEDLHIRHENVAIGGYQIREMYQNINNVFRQNWGEYDLITVMLGTNDLALGAYNSKVETVNSTDYISFINNGSTTIGSSVAYPARLQLFYERLRELWPNAMIVFCTIIKREVNGNMQTTIHEYARRCVENVCAYYGIPHIDVYDTIDPSTKLNRQKYFLHSTGLDGTHPNTIGHALFIAPVVEKGLIEAAKFYNGWYKYFPTDAPASIKVISSIKSGNSTEDFDGNGSFVGAGSNVYVDSIEIGSSKTVLVEGINLTDNIIVAVSNASFSVDRTKISKVAAAVGTELVITHSGEDSSATITFTSGSVTKELTVNYTES